MDVSAVPHTEAPIRSKQFISEPAYRDVLFSGAHDMNGYLVVDGSFLLRPAYLARACLNARSLGFGQALRRAVSKGRSRAVSFIRIPQRAPIIRLGAATVRFLNGEDPLTFVTRFVNSGRRPHDRFCADLTGKLIFSSLVNTPTIVARDESRLPHWYEEEFIGGRPVSDADLRNPRLIGSLARQLARIVAAGPGGEYLSAGDLLRSLACHPGGDAFGAFENARVFATLVHGDMKPKNMIVSTRSCEKDIWIVDWDASHKNTFLFDHLYFLHAVLWRHGISDGRLQELVETIVAPSLQFDGLDAPIRTWESFRVYWLCFSYFMSSRKKASEEMLRSLSRLEGAMRKFFDAHGSR